MPAWNNNDSTLQEIDASLNVSGKSRLLLTIIYHPDLSRVGEFAEIRSGRGVLASLSRHEPLFTPPRSDESGRALGDPYLSRQALELAPRGGGLELRIGHHGSSVQVNRQPVTGTTLISSEALEQGAVICLARRIVLLLHRSSFPCQADCFGMVGDSESINRVRDSVKRVAATDTPVLILGESGTGKEMLAQALHRNSLRSEAPLVTLNMAALPAELAAAELFGVSKGAFTGAETDRQGYFTRAAGGTLFLDEIGACPQEVQPLLLRALQEGEIQVPGGGVRRVDVRCVAATDADVGHEGTFSQALRYRLGGFEIRLPPLRERRDDIGRLTRHFMADFYAPDVAGDPAAEARWAHLLQDFALYNWPGNVRQLANVCEQLKLQSPSARRLEVPGHVLAVLQRSDQSGPAHSGNYTVPERSEPGEAEIRDALLQSRWEISRAARALAMSRQALYRRIRDIPGLRVVADIPGAEIEAVYHQCGGEVREAASTLEVSETALRRRWRAMDLPAADD